MLLFSGDISSKEKPRVYLDSIFVVPSESLTSIDEWGMFLKTENFESSIRKELEEIFNLPHVSSAENESGNDLGLQVAVVSYRGGEFLDFTMPPAHVPIFWRPKIEVHSRLYFLKDDKTFKTFKAVERYSWSDFTRRTLTINGLLLRYKPLYNNKDIENLLVKACFVLVGKMKSSL
ncbi:hypothetical protein K6Q96_07275 [Grimontia kaedaensis]|uniref:Uncharacterized protein n=1 Tax=Grimontia kaedaensis TaxID=2872157 RepID=A0ABY4WXS4_9GAMM|nr:hypothetical protein [Grimontia kaedaensis]USH03785.1 hypothetical protein K6Q96_07275 [Grimontia kaedaensis]